MEHPSPARPDILWIVTTQWRGMALGCNGDSNARTPVLDALASRSINYVSAVTPHPFGPFARAALLTGQPSPANGVVNYHDPLPRNSRTIAHALKEAGYDTAWFGKWHLAPRDTSAALVGETHARQPVLPEDRGGFAHWEGFEGGFQLNDPWLQGDGIGEPVRMPGYQADVVVARIRTWLEARTTPPARAPWFAVLSLENPHPPYAAPAAGSPPPAPSELSLRANVPAGGTVEEQARRELSGYYAHIEATDRALAPLLAHPALANTIIVFTSVHGDMHGSHGLFRKGWPHEESLRIPLLLRFPRSLRRFQLAVTSSDLVSLLDVHHWTRRWAGNPAPDCPPQGPRPHQLCSMPSVVALPLQCDRRWTAVRTATHKLVLNEDGTPWLLHDLCADPLEQANLVNDPSSAHLISTLRSAITGS